MEEIMKQEEITGMDENMTAETTAAETPSEEAAVKEKAKKVKKPF